MAYPFLAKAAGNELRGLINLLNTRHVAPGLHFPLLALIDYRGFRLTALSLLPIHKDSIKYGSSDAGITVHAEDTKLNQIMLEVQNFFFGNCVDRKIFKLGRPSRGNVPRGTTLVVWGY
jgi:hypothetical protein